MWNAETYDNYYKAFGGAIEDYVDWELLKPYLPRDKTAKILDAAGGTGRISLRLTKSDYRVTLSDISSEMLQAARSKMKRNNVLDKVHLLQCDNNHLPYPDNYFDLVLCWDGAFESRHELFRVTKKGGIISIFLTNKWPYVFNRFYDEPDACLAMAESAKAIVHDGDGPFTGLNADEVKSLFESEGINVIDIYAVCGWTDYLSIPDEILKSNEWDNRIFKQTVALVLKLSKEPSIKGLTRHLVLYGEKR
jgi:ubiquinone/menaquinone biosynthesis C-methylase UbiE